MSLQKYHKKRNFSLTPEPKGRVHTTSQRNLFIIQKHAASHLHYDFRLELQGVLLSWAVPKGPCLDPTVKRLAMHVEDHPLEYGGFEGIIPKGEYGGGTVMLWDQGVWDCKMDDPLKAYKAGNLTFSLKAKKLKGQWKLLRMHNDDKTWLLIKIEDQYAKSLKDYDVTVKKPNSVLTKKSLSEITESAGRVWTRHGEKTPLRSKKKISLKKFNLEPSAFPVILPEKATLVSEAPHGNNWLHEIKFDGYRLLAFKQKGKTRLLTRRHNDWTGRFMNVANAIQALPFQNILLDGEIVVLNNEQQSDFQSLQNSIQEDKATAFIYYIFDIVYIENYNLKNLKLIDRKNILKKIIPKNHEILKYSDHVIGFGKTVFKKACELRLEGIISKKIDSPYIESRTKDWLKIKCTYRQEFIICGFTKPQNSRQYFGSLLLGTYDKDKNLIYHGNVGTGFTQVSLKSIYQELNKLKTVEMPFKKKPPGSSQVVWVQPNLVAEVEFSEWTQDGSLRHPSFKGLRSDKKSQEIKREKPMPLNKTIEKSSPYKISNPGKILYEEDKITKEDLANYYSNISEWILPYIVQRPLTLVRCPQNYTHCFYQKHIQQAMPTNLYGIMIKEKTGKDKYIYLKDVKGLIALAQMGVLEIHPWNCEIKKIEYPNLIIFDLDPGPQVSWKKVVEAAFVIREHMKTFKLKCFVKTTGGKGLHIIIPILPEYNWEEVKLFTEVFVNFLVLNNPKDYINVMTKSKRKGKIYIDYLRNQRGATAIAPYSTRARLHAPVATPLDWEELTDNFEDTFFTLKTLPQRLGYLKKDPWKDFFKTKQSLNLKKWIDKIK